MSIKWLLINPHLIASYVCIFVGFILLVLAPILYRVRMKKIIILNPFKIIKEYTPRERNILIAGVILFLMGFLSSVMIEERYGYYYFDNGVPTLLKK
jgi:hypothetical protein